MQVKELPDGFIEVDGKVSRNISFLSEFFSWADWCVFPIVVLTFIVMFLTRFTMVDGESMLPTLEDKQVLLLSDVLYEPAYNDIVIIYADKIPLHDGSGKVGKPIVKRVVGLAGDTIDIDFENGIVWRNGQQLELEIKDGHLYEDGHMINSFTNDREGSSGHFEVPENHVFVMGDNRNDSTDSRSQTYLGYVDRRTIMGKAYMRLYPLDAFGLLGN